MPLPCIPAAVAAQRQPTGLEEDRGRPGLATAFRPLMQHARGGYLCQGSADLASGLSPARLHVLPASCSALCFLQASRRQVVVRADGVRLGRANQQAAEAVPTQRIHRDCSIGPNSSAFPSCAGLHWLQHQHHHGGVHWRVPGGCPLRPGPHGERESRDTAPASAAP
jgi:hypothetical protein